jgi:hypothetical protein
VGVDRVRDSDGFVLPARERLQERGVTFDRYYVASAQCSSSRSVIYQYKLVCWKVATVTTPSYLPLLSAAVTVRFVTLLLAKAVRSRTSVPHQSTEDNGPPRRPVRPFPTPSRRRYAPRRCFPCTYFSAGRCASARCQAASSPRSLYNPHSPR